MVDRPSAEVSNLVRVSRRATLALFTVFVAECAVGSSGRWLMLGPASIRMVLFLACIAVSAPLLWHERRHVCKQGIVWVTAAFIATLAISALWGHQQGNELTFVANDLTTFSALLLVPTVMSLRLTRGEVAKQLIVLLCASAALSVFTIVLHLLVPLNSIDIDAINGWLYRESLGGIADLGNGMDRIYIRSQVLLIAALTFGIYRISCGGTHRLKYVAVSSIVTMGLLLSLTRALWIGFVVALVVLCATRIRDIGKLARSAGLVLVGLAMLIFVSVLAYGGPTLVSSAADRLSPRLAVFAPSDSDGAADNGSDTSPVLESDAEAVEIRTQTLTLHKERISERPVTGWGLGYNLSTIRHDGRTEYMYWDLLMKLGLPGFLVFLLLLAWTPIQLVRDRNTATRRAHGAPLSRVLAASLAGIAVTSYFNPFLNSTLGIVILLLLAAAAAAEAIPADEAVDRPEKQEATGSPR